IPKSLRSNPPNMHIPWEALPIRVATASVEWPRKGGSRIAAVSSFGISGTNAHVILEEAREERPEPPPAERSTELIVVSAKAARALRAAAAHLRAHVEAHPEQALGDVAYTLATARTHHTHRLAMPASGRDAMMKALDATARGESAPGMAHGEVGTMGKLVWL